MNNNNIKKLSPPREKNDAANKKYVDTEIAKLPHSDTGTLKLDGSRAMTGTLDLGGQRVINIKGFVEDDSTQASIDAQFYDVVHWGKIHEIRATIKRNMNAVAYQALNRNNPDPMEDDIDMNNHKIINIADPILKTDIVNKKYVDIAIFKTVNKDGSSTMTGDLDLGGNSIRNIKVSDESNLNYAANVEFVQKKVGESETNSIKVIEQARRAGVGSKSAILRLQSYSGVQCGSGVFFKMAALITGLHEVVQGFIEKPCRATINLDKDTRITIGSEVLQLSRAVIKRHTLGGDSRFRYHLAQPY